MGVIRRLGWAASALAVLSVPDAAAQAPGGAATEAYFGAVAEHFVLPRSEVAILGEWRLPAEEIPVVLFVARRAGVSTEAVVALRRAGRGWAELAARYRLDASHFHVPLAASSAGGPLEEAYRRYRALPPARWREVPLGDAEIVGLVNLRLLTETLDRSPEEILGQPVQGSWVDLYAKLTGGAAPVP